MSWLCLGVSEVRAEDARDVVIAARSWGLSATLLGGLDTYGADGGAAGEFRGASWSDAVVPGQLFGGVVLEGITSTPVTWSDSLYGGNTFDLGGGRWEPQIGVIGRGSVVGPTPWAELSIPFDLSRDMEKAGDTFEISAGPLVRVGSAHVVPGVAAGTLVAGRFSPNFLLLGRGEVRGLFLNPDVPPALFDTGLGAEYQLAHVLVADVWTGVLAAWWADLIDRVAGLPAPGASSAYARLGLEKPLTPSWSLRAEGSFEVGWGQVLYERYRAFAGVAYRRSRTINPIPAAKEVHAGLHEFRFHGPSYYEVEVEIMGTFTDWEPVPLRYRADGVWAVTLRLEPGLYEYLYRVDGETVVPPEATQRRPDGFGGLNGVIVVL